MPDRFANRATFHEEAEKEFLEASQNYSAESDEFADEFEVEVEHGIDLILEHPRIAPTIGTKHVRGKVLRRFPYTLVYATEGGRIRILAVAHQKRRPGYWRSRR